MAIYSLKKKCNSGVCKAWIFSLIVMTCLHLAAAQCSSPECIERLNSFDNNKQKDREDKKPIRATSTTPAPVRIHFPDEMQNVKIPSERFDVKLYQFMANSARGKNLCISPLSVQVLLTFLSTVAEGKLYDELIQLLNLPTNQTLMAQTYQKLTKLPTDTNDSNTIILGNKLYYDERYGFLRRNVRNEAQRIYATDLESVDFLMPSKAADKINSWVADKTQHLIENIVTSDTFRANTMALLVNTVYFKSEWDNKFAVYDTAMRPFFLNARTQIEVETMYMEDIFRYGDFEQLGATVLELPYKLDDFTMMIILPKDIEGLTEVERRLSDITLKLISYRLERRQVIVKIPKFNIEFEDNMIPILQQLGLRSLFNRDSRINIFKHESDPLIVDQIRHKTVINVNEGGTEAAATTYAKIVPLAIPVGVMRFTADHPFIFVIRNSQAVYFIGHVVEL